METERKKIVRLSRDYEFPSDKRDINCISEALELFGEDIFTITDLKSFVGIGIISKLQSGDKVQTKAGEAVFIKENKDEDFPYGDCRFLLEYKDEGQLFWGYVKREDFASYKELKIKEGE